MSPLASPRARRAGGLAALTLGAFALGGPATALAAPDDEAPDPGGARMPESESSTGEVLTLTPLTDPEGDVGAAHFGVGKFEPGMLEPDVVFAPGSSFPAGAVLDRTGAKIRVTYSQVGGTDTADPVEFPDGPPVLECTWDELDTDDNGNLCDFTGFPDFTDDGQALLFPNSAFTITLTHAPTRGQVLLPAVTEISGYTDWAEGGDEAVFQAPGAYRSIGVTITDTKGAVVGATFELCTVAGGTCAPTSASGVGVSAVGTPVVSATSLAGGQLTFPGVYLPGTYQIRQTASADGSPFSTAPRVLTLTAASSPADTTAPVFLPVALPTVTDPATPVATAPVSSPSSAPAAATTSAPTTAGPTAAAVTAAAPASTGKKLASTGAEPLPILTLGAGLVLAGGAVTVAATRRRRTR